MDTINIMHRVFDEMIEKSGRIYRLFHDGPTVTAVGGVPFGLDLDPVHSISQIALDYLIWGHNSRAPSQSALHLRFGLHSGSRFRRVSWLLGATLHSFRGTTEGGLSDRIRF